MIIILLILTIIFSYLSFSNIQEGTNSNIGSNIIIGLIDLFLISMDFTLVPFLFFIGIITFIIDKTSTPPTTTINTNSNSNSKMSIPAKVPKKDTGFNPKGLKRQVPKKASA
jgi:hypothetical protein